MSKFLDFYPEVPKKIVEVLARTLSSLTPPVSKSSGSSNNPSEDEKRLMLSLLLCLGEWVMRMPNYALTQPQEDGRSLLHHVFGALQTAGGVQAARRDGASTSPSPLSSDHARNRKEAFPKQANITASLKDNYGECIALHCKITFVLGLWRRDPHNS